MKIYAWAGAFGIVFFLLPSLVAAVLRRSYLRQLFVCNLVTGLTFAGWLGTLSWALTNKPYPFDARKNPKTRLASLVFLGAFLIEVGAIVVGFYVHRH
ncbi:MULTISPECIES: superinfection immunity protein [Asaia]|uniref:superinfection immunity protein n=1 Tax=Asaia TaxID=91914 RepID=UPI002FC2B864